MASATTTRCGHSDVTHVSVHATADDIRVLNHEGQRRRLEFGPTYVHLDTDGVTRLLELLLAEPEATDRPELRTALEQVVANRLDAEMSAPYAKAV